jgi:hypothetical protein
MQISIINTVYDSVLILWPWSSVCDLTRSYPIPYVVQMDINETGHSTSLRFLSVYNVPFIFSHTSRCGSVNNDYACFYREKMFFKVFCCFFFYHVDWVCYDPLNDSVTQNSSVITVTRLRGSISFRDEIFLVSKVSIPPLGPTQPTVQWVQGAVSPGVKWRGVKLTTCIHLANHRINTQKSPIEYDLSIIKGIQNVYSLNEGCTNPVARATKLSTVAPNICGSSVWNFLHVTLLAPRILRWLLDFF